MSMNDYYHKLRQTPEYKAEVAERNAREIERKTQLLATKSSQGYISAIKSEKEKILDFFKVNNYRQLFPDKNKFKSGSFYYVIEETGPDDASYLAPIKKKCISVSNGGLECILSDVKGYSSNVTKNLTRDEIYERQGYFGKSATNDWKLPENYKDKFVNNSDMVKSAVMAATPFNVTTGGKRKTKRRKHSVRKIRKKHRKQSHRKQRKSRRK